MSLSPPVQEALKSLFEARMRAKGIEPIQPVKGQDYRRPGKLVCFIGARGFGAEAREFYDRPDLYGLCGNPGDVLDRCAAAWGWETRAELEAAIDEEIERGRG